MPHIHSCGIWGSNPDLSDLKSMFFLQYHIEWIIHFSIKFLNLPLYSFLFLTSLILHSESDFYVFPSLPNSVSSRVHICPFRPIPALVRFRHFLSETLKSFPLNAPRTNHHLHLVYTCTIWYVPYNLFHFANSSIQLHFFSRSDGVGKLFFFCKEADRRYFRLCRTHHLCCTYSSSSIERKHSHRQYVNKSHKLM